MGAGSEATVSRLGPQLTSLEDHQEPTPGRQQCRKYSCRDIVENVTPDSMPQDSALKSEAENRLQEETGALEGEERPSKRTCLFSCSVAEAMLKGQRGPSLISVLTCRLPAACTVQGSEHCGWPDTSFDTTQAFCAVNLYAAVRKHFKQGLGPAELWVSATHRDSVMPQQG